MTKKLGVVMDPIGSINYKKDSTLAMLLEAARRGWTIYYFEQKDLFLRDGMAFGKSKLLSVFADKDHWFEFGAEQETPLSSLNLIFWSKRSVMAHWSLTNRSPCVMPMRNYSQHGFLLAAHRRW
jgi:glutathione synthase